MHRLTLEFTPAGQSMAVASVGYDDPDKALQAYRQASEEFRASKQPPGASLSLNDQKLEFHGGAVSEGLGVSRVGWLKDSARERFEQLAPVNEDRPELAALRAAFAGRDSKAELSAPIPEDWRGPACAAFDREMGVRLGDPGYSKAQELASTLNHYDEMSFEPSKREAAILASKKDAIEEARSWVHENVLSNPTIKALMYETVRDYGRETGDPLADAGRRAYLAEMSAAKAIQDRGGLPSVEVVDVDQLPDWTVSRTTGKSAESAKPEPMQIDPADLQRVASVRERDTAQARDGLSAGADKASAEPRGGSIEGLERATQREATAQGSSANAPVGDSEEREDSLRKRYLRTAEGYHDKQTMELVIADKGDKLSTQREDVPTVDALATAAADRGWATVAVSGTEAFKREAWYQMAARGIEVTGYSPTAADKARLAEAGREQPERAPAAAAKDKDKAQDKAAPIPARSPAKEAAEAVRQLAPDIAIESPATPREGLAVNAAANAAHGAAVAANERAREGVQGRGADLAKPPQKAQELQQPKLSGEQQVMINAVDRVLREGGLSAEQRERVRQVATKNVSEKNPEVKPPKVADRAAIPQPVASNGPKQNAKRDLSR